MKKTLSKIIFVFFVGILSCKKSDLANTNKQVSFENVEKPYFDYDEIEYFHSDINIDLEGLLELYDELEKKTK